MSKCDVRIECDRADRKYQGGGKIAGKVYVRANKEVTFKTFKITLSWETHGKGNTDSEIVSEKCENGLIWRAETEYVYPFDFDLPAAPLTYHGHYINIDYYVKARVDIPWSIDPEAREVLLVLPGIAVKEVEKTKSRKDKLDASQGRKPKKLKDFIPTTLPAILATVLVVLGVVYFFPTALIIFLVSVIFFNKPIRSAWAERKLGSVIAEFKGGRVYPGDSLPVRLRFNRTGIFKVNAVTATVSGKEICEAGSGTSSRTFKHKLHEERFALAPTSSRSFRGKIEIPATEAYSFDAPDNSITWEVTLHVDVPRWPDWQKSYPIDIVHRAEEGSLKV